MKKTFKNIFILIKTKWKFGLLILPFLVIHLLAWFNVFEGTPNPNVGILNNRLVPCDESSTCYVSRPPENGPHYVHSILPAESWDAVRGLLKSYYLKKGCGNAVEDNQQYLRFECRTFFFRTTDDLEFYFSDSEGRLHLKFQARLSWLDWGRQLRQIRKLRSAIGRSDDAPVGKHW